MARRLALATGFEPSLLATVLLQRVSTPGDVGGRRTEPNLHPKMMISTYARSDGLWLVEVTAPGHRDGIRARPTWAAAHRQAISDLIDDLQDALSQAG